jgi:hypothetical protein
MNDENPSKIRLFATYTLALLMIVSVAIMFVSLLSLLEKQQKQLENHEENTNAIGCNLMHTNDTCH